MSAVACGHSACSQHYIDTGSTECVEAVDVAAVLTEAATYVGPDEAALLRARAAVAELIECAELGAQAIEQAAKCVSPELALVLGDRATFLRAALARVQGGGA